tara:strand:- start:1915 stop:3084 length:1170 start_codon:yes stop_codon:yes gene_type:complete
MSGVQYSTLYFAKELKKHKRINYRLLIPRRGPFSQLCDINAIPFEIYPSMSYVSTSLSLFTDRIRIPNPFSWIYNLFSMIHNSSKIKSILKKGPNSIILSKGLLSHFVASIACFNSENYLVWYLQDLISSRYGGLYHFIFNYIANKSPNLIICDGRLIKENLNPIAKIKTKVILNGIDIKKYKREGNKGQSVRDEFSIPDDGYVIGNIGRMTPWKGQEKLLDAFVPYSKINGNAYLLLIGSPVFDNDKYYKKIKLKILKNHLEDRIILPGYRSDLSSVYSAIDLFIFPSLEKDTSPLSLLGAMVFGLPVALSSIPSLREISDLISGLESFDPNQQNQMQKIFLKFENQTHRRRTGKLIQKQAIKEFSMSRYTENVLGFIECNLKNRSIT